MVACRGQARQAGVFFPESSGVALESDPTSRMTKGCGPFPHTSIPQFHPPLWDSAGQCGVVFIFFTGGVGLSDGAQWRHSGPWAP